MRQQREIKSSLRIPRENELFFTHISEFELMEPWTTAKVFVPNSLDPSSSGIAETEFVTFRPQSHYDPVQEDPSQNSSQTSMLYEDLDIYDEPLPRGSRGIAPEFEKQQQK
jgi:hypothetical protein